MDYDMKHTKYFLALAALAGFAAFSCTRNEETLPAIGERVVIRAAISEGTRTNFADETTFSWVEGDIITVQLVNKQTGAFDQFRFQAQETGPISDFVSVGDLDTDTYELGTLAFYPKNGRNNADMNYNPSAGTVSLAGTVFQDADYPLSCVPMIGTKQTDGTYHFAIATGVLKFTLENLPADAGYMFLAYDGDERPGFNGTYAIAEDNTISMATATDPWPEKYTNLIPDANGDVTFYLPIPEGTIPAGAYIGFIDTGWTRYLEESITLVKPIEVKRGILTTVAPYRFPDPTPVDLSDVVGTWEMTVTAGSYSYNAQPGTVVIEESDDTSKGNVMLTMFAGFPGKQYGTYERGFITFPKDQLFGANPYGNAADYPYVALVSHNGSSAIDPRFEVVEPGKKLQYADNGNIGFRATTPELWADYNGAWPWELCYRTVVLTVKGPEDYSLDVALAGTGSATAIPVTVTMGADIAAVKFAVVTDPAAASVETATAGTATASGTVDVALPATLTPGDDFYIVYYALNAGGEVVKTDQIAWTYLQIPLTAAQVSGANEITWDGIGFKGLVDGDLTTYWHSDWYYAVTGNDPVWGMFIDVALEEAISNVTIRYYNRNNNLGACPTQILIGASSDGTTWKEIATATNGVDGVNLKQQSVTLPEYDLGGSYTYIRFGILDSASGDPGSLTGDLNFDGYKKCVNMAELMLYGN